MKRSLISIALITLISLPASLGLVSCDIGSKVVEEATATEPRTPSFFEEQKAKEEASKPTIATYAPPPGASGVAAPSEVIRPADPVDPIPGTPEPVAPIDEPVAPAPDGMENLVTAFPTPMFVGTPVPANLPNLEIPTGKPKKTMPVPAGTKNIAIGKTITSSDPEPTIGELDFVTDGDKEGGDGYFVELGPNAQWVQIDLEKEFDIHAIFLWHFHKNSCAYLDVIVQISNDPEFVEATMIYNNDHDNSSGLGIGADLAYVETNHGRLIDAKGTRGRYVRLGSNGNTSNDLNHYIEVEVHATE
jgi:hypothetical protein